MANPDPDHDYREIDYPKQDDYEPGGPNEGEEYPSMADWHYAQRRAYILENHLLDKGHPDMVNWSELARLFDKSKSTIHRDKERLTEYLSAGASEERMKALGMSLFESGLLEITSDDDRDAFEEVKFYKMWVTTLREFGTLPPAANRSDLDDDGELKAPDEINVSVGGVSASDVDLDDDEAEGIPDRDLPDAYRDEGDEEAQSDEQTAEPAETN